MKDLRSIATKLVAAVFILLIASCVPPSYQHVSKDVDQEQDQLDKKYQPIKMSTQVGPLVLDSTSSQPQPAWLKAKINLHARGMEFNQVADKVLQNSPAANAFENDINQSLPVNINFNGSRTDALKLLSAQTGYAYTIDGSIITWSSLMTRTFDVSFMPGSSKYLVGEKDNSTGSSSSSGSSGASSSVGSQNLDNNGEYSSIEGNFSLWKDLENTIKGMLSDKGKVDVSEATTTITITDHPDNVRQVQTYLGNMNQSLSRQVALDVEVIEINLNKAFQYGVDWDLVRSFTSGRYHVSLLNSSGKVLNTALESAGATGPQILTFAADSGVWNTTNTVINALEQQGKVSVATQPRVVTLNNQVAQIGINTLTTYLAQVSTTQIAQAGATTALTPGQVTTGFTLYLLPKIQGNNIYLQISSTIASLLAMKEFDGNTQPQQGSSSQSSSNSIFGPVVSQKRFNQRSLVPSGATLVLAGFKQLRNEANKDTVFGSDALGGYGGNKDNVETIVLITPKIVNLKD